MKHEIIDQRNLDMGKLISQKLMRNPRLFHVIKKDLQERLVNPKFSESIKENYQEWVGIIEKGNDTVYSVLTSPCEEGNRLRQSNPFTSLITQEERFKILSKYEPLRTRTRTSGSQDSDRRDRIHRLRKSVHFGQDARCA